MIAATAFAPTTAPAQAPASAPVVAMAYPQFDLELDCYVFICSDGWPVYGREYNQCVDNAKAHYAALARGIDFDLWEETLAEGELAERQNRDDMRHPLH